ncbi:hypothetical protein ATANTOWER_022515 [Ataeniobius toweri]|uniref:Uncharacterized protein n=1 Tax=Ataeniobius toweri TaxID=208326 RepID=A0ABU7C8X8_9TELE|nr:hypothetical protein [Ataeniobius toweri]
MAWHYGKIDERGCPSSLGDVESVDWALTVNLGHQQSKPRSEASLQRDQMMKLKAEQQRRSECVEAMLDLSAEHPRMNPEETGTGPTLN